MLINKKNRKYKVRDVLIKDAAHIILKSNEQITLKDTNDKFQYDICKKSWGYYALPSINSRLKKFNFETFIIKDIRNEKVFIHIVKKNKMKEFKKYLKNQKLKIIDWPKNILKK